MSNDVEFVLSLLAIKLVPNLFDSTPFTYPMTSDNIKNLFYISSKNISNASNQC